MKKRLLVLFLCVLMCLSVVLASCNNNTNVTSKPDQSTSDASQDTTSNSGGSTENGYNSETGRYESAIDKKAYSGSSVSILCPGETMGTYYCEGFLYDPELTGQTINDASGERFSYIEEYYGLTFEIIKAESNGTSIQELVANDNSAGTHFYDIAFPWVRSAAVMAQNGSLLDLTNYEDTIHINMPWYDQNLVEGLSVGGSLYFLTGDIDLLNKICTNAITFNKDLIVDGGMENPYDLVKSKDWTIDKMYEMGKSFSENLEDPSWGYEDKVGLSSSYGDAINLFKGFAKNLCSKDENDIPILSLTEDSTITALQKLVTYLSDAEFCIHAQQFQDDIWTKSLGIFSEGRALFRTSAFSATKKLRATDCSFGIVPLPLYDENQEDYMSFCATNNTVACAVIPFNCKDENLSAFAVEALSVEGKNFLTPVYYDVVLKERDTRDDESKEMLDIIFSNITYDIGHVFNFGNISTLITDLVSKAAPNQIQSTIDTNKDAINTAIDDIKEKFDLYS